MNEVLVAVIGILVPIIIGYFISLLLSFKEKRRELMLTYLIEAYTAIENSAYNEIDLKLENAIGIIQLFGTTRQIDLAKQMAFDLANHKMADLDDLLLDLRNSLRRELKLEEYKGGIFHFRVSHDNTE